MASVTVDDSVNVKRLLEEVNALMGLESVAGKMDVRKPDFAELRDFTLSAAGTLPQTARCFFENLGLEFENRIRSVYEIGLSDKRLFRSVFNQEPPQGLRVKRRPYSVQFEMDGEDFEQLCVSRGMKRGYADSQGICLDPEEIAPSMRERLGGSVILTRAYYEPRLIPRVEAQLADMVIPRALTRGNFHIRVVKHERVGDPVLDRHEELHAAQNLAIAAGYPSLNGGLEQNLLDEEQAEYVAEMDNGVKPERDLLSHTNYYLDFGVAEGAFAALARKYYNRVGEAFMAVQQRAKNEAALARLRSETDGRLGRVVGWALPFMDFYRADKILSLVPAVYETM